MQATPAACRALRGELRVSNSEIRERTRTDDRPDGYHETRIARVLNGGESSQPLLDAVFAALGEIRDEQRAAAGDRAAMARLDGTAASTARQADKDALTTS